MDNTTTVIIGGGPAGMAAAMELSRAGKKFKVFEKNIQVGGLARTYEFKEGGDVFRTDNGPHRFFSKNKYLYDFVEDLLHEKWITVQRQTRQYIGGKFYDYPVKPLQAFQNMGIIKTVRILVDYVYAQLKFKVFRRPIRNFEDYIVANFGRTLGEFNMINYSEKIWGIRASTIHIDWASQRIKGLNLFSTIKDIIVKFLFNNKTDQPKSLIDVFYYPEQGTGQIYEAIKEKIIAGGNEVKTKSFPTKIKHCEKKITQVVMNEEGQETSYGIEYLVESIPIHEFVQLLEPTPPIEIMESVKNLRYRAQVYLFITLDKEKVTSDQWIYFPEKSIPFARISEMKNFSDKMSPKGKTSLFIEYFCFENDAIWNMSKEELLALTSKYLVEFDFITPEEIRSVYLVREKDAYPIYDLEYKTHIEKIKNYLDGFANLYYIGRPGRFRYTNQDHSLEMGILAAKSILEGKKLDIENVAAGKEYFEKGYANK